MNNRSFRIWKTKSLFNLKSQQPDIDKIYFYAKNPYEAKYQLLINKQESAKLKHLNDFKAFIEHSNDMDDIYKNIYKTMHFYCFYYIILFGCTKSSTHYFIIKIPNKQELQQIAFNNLSDI